RTRNPAPQLVRESELACRDELIQVKPDCSISPGRTADLPEYSGGFRRTRMIEQEIRELKQCFRGVGSDRPYGWGTLPGLIPNKAQRGQEIVSVGGGHSEFFKRFL